jgi:hypothetical protein
VLPVEDIWGIYSKGKGLKRLPMSGTVLTAFHSSSFQPQMKSDRRMGAWPLLVALTMWPDESCRQTNKASTVNGYMCNSSLNALSRRCKQQYMSHTLKCL